MVGAYQEILGDLHNLFGDTDSVHVELSDSDPKGYRLTQAVKGESVAEVLSHVQFDDKKLMNNYQVQLDNTELSATKKQQFVDELASGLAGYTYFED